MSKLNINAGDLINKINQDQDIDESQLTYYHGLITENLRSNNNKITRNSYILIISISLYFFILFDKTNISNISLSFFKIQDDTLLLNFIPIVFAFVYLRNITLWNNNINLNSLFDSTSRKIFNLSLFTDTVNIIKPFSFLHHIINYQYSNQKVKWFLKIPLALLFLILLFGPLVFNVISIYVIIFRLPSSPLSYFSCSLIAIFSFVALIQSFNGIKG